MIKEMGEQKFCEENHRYSIEFKRCPYCHPTRCKKCGTEYSKDEFPVCPFCDPEFADVNGLDYNEEGISDEEFERRYIKTEGISI